MVKRKCPKCERALQTGEEVYACDVCGQDCCTACGDTTDEHDVVCDRRHE